MDGVWSFKKVYEKLIYLTTYKYNKFSKSYLSLKDINYSELNRTIASLIAHKYFIYK